ncbi:helix-turn-helix domain-containing protein [Actinacidiphila sp. SB3-2]
MARISVLIARRFRVRFSKPQLSRLLRQMGFTVQAPVHRAAERGRSQTLNDCCRWLARNALRVGWRCVVRD